MAVSSGFARDAADPASSAALAGLRVLDLSGPMGNYCGKLLADMGADVVLVEPPAGTHLRHEPPFISDVPGIERSLSFAYHNTSKRGITLNLETARGQELLLQLAAAADVLIETEKPGVMEQRGLGYGTLARLRPGVVMTRITAFGQTGPYAQYEGEDLIGLALSGFLNLAGYPDVAPSRVYGNQAFLCAAMYGAVATLLAVLDAEACGEGQEVDVSMQECVVLALENSVQFYDLEGSVRQRYAGEQRFAGTGVFECADGYVYLMAGGVGENKFWGKTLDWLSAEGVQGVERLHGPQWLEHEWLKTAEAKRIFDEVFTTWAKTRSKSALYHGGQARHIPIAPINSPSDLLANEQLRHRGHFVQVTHMLHEQPLTMPGAPYRLSATPWRIQRRAPTLGEHNAEIYGELGLGVQDLEPLFAAGVI